jgi:hypothetical protein
MAKELANEFAERLRAGGWDVWEEAVGAAPNLVWLVRGE